jgi:hypothetical protein
MCEYIIINELSKTIRIILRFGYEKVTKLELFHDPTGKIVPIYQKKIVWDQEKLLLGSCRLSKIDDF